MTHRDNYPFRALLAAAVALPVIAAATAASAAAKPDTGRQAENARELSSCLTLAQKTPEQAMESALSWEDRGGGDRAKLCQAMALFHRGQNEQAAARLEALAPRFAATDAKQAANVLDRAGWAWLRAGRADRAEQDFTAALARQPDDPDILTDRGFARGEAHRYAEAVEDLSRAIAKGPKNADPWYYRAGAYWHLGDFAKAAKDVTKVLELSPDSPDAYLLRGNIRVLTGDAGGAREDWERVRRLAPDTPGAQSAAVNLKRLDNKELAGEARPEKK